MFLPLPKPGITRKYVLIFAALVGGALLGKGLVQQFFSYQDQRSSLAGVEREKAETAAESIEQFINDISLQVRGVANASRGTGSIGTTSRRTDYLRLLG